MSKKILVVDDETDIQESLRGILEDDGYEVLSASSGLEALDLIEEEHPDLVLLDIWMPGIDGMQTLERIKNRFPEVAVVMISGHGNIETAVRATKLGAYDFIEKPLSLDRVLIVVANAFRMSMLNQENESLRRVMGIDGDLVGESVSAKELRQQIFAAAGSDCIIAIIGEQGSGRSLAARQIHRNSTKRSMPFITLNCRSVPEDLLESEILGSGERRSGKKAGNSGCLLDDARGGILFLDGIEGISSEILSRVIKRLSGHNVLAPDLLPRLFLSSTSIKSFQLVDGLSKVSTISVPPLRSRMSDIPLLAKHFADNMTLREGLPAKSLSEDALSLMLQYNWPGNIRELKNTIERAVLVSGSELISADDISEIIQIPEMECTEMNSRADKSLNSARREFERCYIRSALIENSWDIGKTGEMIGLERTVLMRKINYYGIRCE